MKIELHLEFGDAEIGAVEIGEKINESEIGDEAARNTAPSALCDGELDAGGQGERTITFMRLATAMGNSFRATS
jgi:hypothetical protein